MLKLSNINWNRVVEIEKNKVTSVYIENRIYFRRMVEELIYQNNGNDGEFVLSKNEKEVSIKSRVELITDIYNVNPNDKKIIKYIFSDFACNANIEMVKTSDILMRLSDYFNYFLEQFPIEFNRNSDIELTDLIKIGGYYVEYEEKNTLDRLISYISVVKEYINPDIFVVINLLEVLNDVERNLFTELMIEKGISILCIEVRSFQRNKNDFKNEKIYILDDDLCEI